MKYLSIVAFAMGAVAVLEVSCSSSEHPIFRSGATQELSLPPDFARRTFEGVSGLSDVPKQVTETFAKMCGGCIVADREDPWQATDVVDSAAKLPVRHFVSAGVSGSLWVVQYAHGGEGVHDHVAVFELGATGANYVGGGTLPGELLSGLTPCDVSSNAQAKCEW